MKRSEHVRCSMGMGDTAHYIVNQHTACKIIRHWQRGTSLPCVLYVITKHNRVFVGVGK